MSIENELDELYRELILDHYRRPRNTDLLPDAQLKAEGTPYDDDIQVGVRIETPAAAVIEKAPLANRSLPPRPRIPMSSLFDRPMFPQKV